MFLRRRGLLLQRDDFQIIKSHKPRVSLIVQNSGPISARVSIHELNHVAGGPDVGGRLADERVGLGIVEVGEGFCFIIGTHTDIRLESVCILTSQRRRLMGAAAIAEEECGVEQDGGEFHSGLSRAEEVDEKLS